MEPQNLQFLNDMIRDSQEYEKQEEHGQAFDKLARGLESLFNQLAGNTQTEKAAKFFVNAMENDPSWSAFKNRARGIEYFCEEFGYEIAKGYQRSLGNIAANIKKAVDDENRADAALGFGQLVMLIRNKRFHGYPEFSGRNIRVAKHASDLLFIMRHCLLQITKINN